MIWYFNSVLWPPCVQSLRSGFSTGWADHNGAAYWWRLKGDGALRTVWPSAAPAFQHQPFQMQLDNTGWCPASDWPLSRLVTKPATEEHSYALTPPRSNSISPMKGGAARGQGQLPGWPLMSHHVWTCPRTKHTRRDSLEYVGMKEGKRAPDCFKQLFVRVYVCVYDVGMATWSVTAGPLDLPWNRLQMCSSCPRSLCSGPGGRNYTGDDPVLLSPPAFQVWA